MVEDHRRAQLAAAEAAHLVELGVAYRDVLAIQRLAVLAVCTLAFFAFGGVLLGRFRRESRRPERLFAASVAELEQDLRQLKAMTGHEPPAR